jgi:hypothetical protein
VGTRRENNNETSKISGFHSIVVEDSGLLGYYISVVGNLTKPDISKALHSFNTLGYVKLPAIQCNIPEDQNP